MPPRIVITIATTAAKMGRSTKKCEKPIFRSLRRSAGRGLGLLGLDLAGLRGDLCARPRPDQAIDDDPVLRIDAAADDAQATGLARAGADDLGMHDAVAVDREHDLARLVGDDRRVRD